MSVPAGVEHGYVLDGSLTRFATMYAPGGLERLFELAGELAEQRIFPETVTPADGARLGRAAGELDLMLPAATV
jgi:hypothetical protein